MNDEQPYLIETEVITKTTYKYNPNYGDGRLCDCGHSYYRHFDSWEDMRNVGCKYCPCVEFKEAILTPEKISELEETLRTHEPKRFNEIEKDFKDGMIKEKFYHEQLLELNYISNW